MSTLSPDVFRQVMRHVPSPVAVVTARGEDECRGITIGSFTSLSLDPPLISFNVGQESRIYPLLTPPSPFALHLLSARQCDLSRRFSQPKLSGKEQFEDIPYQLTPDGPPILDQTPLVLHCETDQRVEVGEKSIMIGRVLDAQTDTSFSSLLYFRHDYYGIDETDNLIRPLSNATT